MSRLPRLPIFTPHTLVVAVAAVVVAGGGFWSQTISPVASGGADDITSVGPTSSSPASADGRTVASTLTDVLAGYVSSAAISVTPEHLAVDTYEASEGETVSQIARKFGLSPDTILWANGLTDPDSPLAPMTQLRIPPADGMLHLVHDGDTLENISARYGVETEIITNYEANGVEHTADLVPYRLLMVPGGEMPARNSVVTHIVREGDTLSSIASRYGIDPTTVLWANNLPNEELIVPGQHLAILPTDGVMVQVDSEDSIESLASKWNVGPEVIRDHAANGLGASGSLIVGQYIMIPGAQPPAPPAPEPAPEPATVAELPVADEETASAPVEQSPAAPPAEPASESQGTATGSFTWPTTGVITQYYHAGHNGWDIANTPYTEIWAADGGTVSFAGWNNFGLGYAVAIDHGNGYVTWYGHMAEHPPVQTGQRVDKGQFIGPMGSTGNSTGPHIHFVITYDGVYQNPGSYLR